MAEMEAVAMNRQFWICGFVRFGGMLLNAQDVSPVTRENLEGALGNRSVLLVELVRQAEAGDNYAQYCGPNTYITGRGVLKNDAEAVRWCLQAARKGVPEAQNRMGYLHQHGIECLRIMGRRCVGLAMQQSRNCQQRSTTSLICINMVRACRLTMLGRQIYTAKPRPKVWHELETS